MTNGPRIQKYNSSEAAKSYLVGLSYGRRVAFADVVTKVRDWLCILREHTLRNGIVSLQVHSKNGGSRLQFQGNCKAALFTITNHFIVFGKSYGNVVVGWLIDRATKEHNYTKLHTMQSPSLSSQDIRVMASKAFIFSVSFLCCSS